MKLNWKSIWNLTIPLIMVLGIVFSGVKLGIGFYYKTNDKLDIHETKIKDLEIKTENVPKLEESVEWIKGSLKRIEGKL